MTHWFVLPSPYLGREAYLPFVDALAGGGDTSSVARTSDVAEPEAIVAAWVEEVGALASDDLVLLPHSNAGLLAPLVAARAGARSVVFVDAALPVPGEGTAGMAPEGLLGVLEDLADEHGMLPKWTRWWARDQIAETLPGEWLERVDLVVPRVPVSYAASRVEVPVGWELGGGRAYLAFGETYSEEILLARRLGWPVEVLAEAGHAHVILAAEETADAVRRLRQELSGEGR